MKKHKARDRARALRREGFALDAIVKQLTAEKLTTTYGSAPSRAAVARWIGSTRLPKVSTVVAKSNDLEAFYATVKGIVSLPFPAAKQVQAIRAIL